MDKIYHINQHTEGCKYKLKLQHRINRNFCLSLYIEICEIFHGIYGGGIYSFTSGNATFISTPGKYLIFEAPNLWISMSILKKNVVTLMYRGRNRAERKAMYIRFERVALTPFDVILFSMIFSWNFWWIFWIFLKF